MKPYVYTLENEKRIFMVIISTMLLSLVLMSISYRFVKDENEEIKQDLMSISTELDLLAEILPEKDAEISHKEEEIRKLTTELKLVLTNYNLTTEERDKLSEKVQVLKQEIKSLKQDVKQYQEKEVEKAAEFYMLTTQNIVYNDSMIDARYRGEIEYLKQTIEDLRSKKPGIVLKDKLYAYYFEAVSSDKRSRASKTEYISINLQLRGDVSEIDGVLSLEIVDPEKSLISEKSQKVRASNSGVVNIKFKPENYRFIKGKYAIRLYAANTDFETKTSVVLR